MRPVFIPVIGKPGGDANACTAVWEALKSWEEPEGGFAVSTMHLQVWNKLEMQLVDEDELGNYLDNLRTYWRDQGKEPVLFYAGAEIINYMREISGPKAATTHLSPAKLNKLVHAEQLIPFTSVKISFGLEMLSCPAHACERQSGSEYESGDILWTKSVPAQVVDMNKDLSADAVFADAAYQDFAVFSLPAETDDEEADEKSQQILAGIIKEEAASGLKPVLVVNPRTGNYLHGLEKLLGNVTYPRIEEDGAFISRVLPAVHRNKNSCLFIPNNSASVLAKASEALPAQQLVLLGFGFRKKDHRLMAHYFHHDMGCVKWRTNSVTLTSPTPPDYSIAAAYDVAGAMIERFAENNAQPFKNRFICHLCKKFTEEVS